MSDPYNSTDAYADALQAQNEGGFCEHCNSISGHFRNCGLINRNAGEAQRAIKGELSKADETLLHGLGVQW
jgi:hypothetical protein